MGETNNRPREPSPASKASAAGMIRYAYQRTHASAPMGVAQSTIANIAKSVSQADLMQKRDSKSHGSDDCDESEDSEGDSEDNCEDEAFDAPFFVPWGVPLTPICYLGGLPPTLRCYQRVVASRRSM